MTPEEKEEEIQKKCDKILFGAVAQLSEHFENVQIFVNRQENNKTRAGDWGTGNIFARESQVRDWITMADARTRARAMGIQPNNPDLSDETT